MGRDNLVTHFFPGANTPQGYYPRYDQIAPADANRIYILKGGPGTGKSTFMRRTADDLLSRGFPVEMHHCSADNESLDAIYIPAAGVAILDGTAPHVVDPRFPGALDEIINLGAFWNDAALRTPHARAEIVRLTQACSFRFRRAHAARKSAVACLEEWKAFGVDCLDTAAVDRCAEQLRAELLPNLSETKGAVRRLFASAITYDGPKDWLASLFGGAAKRYLVAGEPGTGKSIIMERLAEGALARGCAVDLYHCPMYPERVNHLLLRATSTAVLTSCWPHEYAPAPEDTVINANRFLDQDRYAGYKAEVAAARDGFFAAVNREIRQLTLAKETHDELERLYRPHMDFEAIEALRRRTVKQILALAERR